MKDFTVTKQFSEEDYNELLQQAVAVLPWGHNLLLMNYDLSPESIVFYANEVYAYYLPKNCFNRSIPCWCF